MIEVWATYSVKDHLQPKAFISDVMLYDRLVIPIPDKNDLARWRDWNPERQGQLLEILGDRVETVVWDEHWRGKWKTRMDAAKDIGEDMLSPYAFRMTPHTLMEKVSKKALGVASVAAFSSPIEMQLALGLREVQPLPDRTIPLIQQGLGSIAAVIGCEFLVPDDPRKTDDELLKEAVDISSGTRFRRKRAAYWRWQREFLSRCTILNQRALDMAVEEMAELIEDEKAEVRKSNVKLGASFSFAAGAAAIGMFTPPVAPLAIAAGFLSIGGWAIDHIPELLDPASALTRPAAMCVSAQKEFGWRQ